MAGRKSEIKKAQYYVCYLGWLESEGLRGHEYTDPVIYELLQRSRAQYIPITKLTVQISKKEIKLTQEMEKGRTKVEKVKYPAIPAKDVTFACQGPAPDDDIVAAVYLGYNPQTRRAVHVHVYRCDSSETAARMVGHLGQLVDLPDHKHRHAKVEKELQQKGLITRSQVRPTPQYGDRDSSGSGYSERVEGNHMMIPVLNGRSKTGSTGSSGGSGAGSEGKEAPNLPAYDSVAAELREKLQRKNKQIPILLPPRDYDTISRSHGKVDLGLGVAPESPPEQTRKVSDHSMGSRTSSHGANDNHYRNTVEHNKTSDSGVDIPPDYEQEDENVCNNSQGSYQLRMDTSRYAEKHVSRSSSRSSASDWSHDPSDRQRYHQQADDGYYSYDRPHQTASPRPQAPFYPVRSPPIERRPTSPVERRVKSGVEFDRRRTMSPGPREPSNRRSEPLSPRDKRVFYHAKQHSGDLGYSMPEKELRKGLRRQISEDRTSEMSRKSDPIPIHLQAKPVGRSTSFQVHR